MVYQLFIVPQTHAVFNNVDRLSSWWTHMGLYYHLPWVFFLVSVFVLPGASLKEIMRYMPDERRFTWSSAIASRSANKVENVKKGKKTD